MQLFESRQSVVVVSITLLLMASACQAPRQSVADAPVASRAPVELESETQVAIDQLSTTQRGVALSPASYEGTDLPDFLEIVDGSVDLLMHAGDWAELADETSSFRVLSELAAQRSIDTMLVLSPSNGTQLIRPLDAVTMDSYLASLRAFLADHQPRYLGLGNELNLVETRSAAEFEQTAALYDEAIDVVREMSPETQVFVTFQYEWLVGRRDGWFGRSNDPATSQWHLLNRFADADAIGITTYPGLVHEHPNDIEPSYYGQIRAHTELPVIITESGWSAAAGSAGFAGSEDEQVAFAAAILEQAERLDSPAVVWTFLFSTQVVEPAFADMGLWRDDATPRPAWSVWSGAVVDTDTAPSASLPPPTDLVPVWTVPFPAQLPLTVVADTAHRPFVYVAAKNGGVAVISAGEDQGEIIAQVERSAFGADAMHLTQQGDTLAIALGDFFSRGNRAGLALVDVRDPNKPVLLSTTILSDADHGAADVVVDGNVAYLAAMEHGVFALDIADPASPTLLGQFRPDPDFPKANPTQVGRPNARGLAIDAGLLYVANDAGGLRIIDVADPTNMRELGRYINPRATKQQAYNDVVVIDSHAFVSLDYCGFEVVDVADPSAMRQVAWLDPWNCNDLSNLWLNSPGHGNELSFDAQRRTIYMSAGDSEVVAIDIADITNPRVSAVVGEPGNDRGTYGLGAAAGSDPLVFATYITAIIPFQGRSAEVVAFAPE